jgi:hypothetical protein
MIGYHYSPTANRLSINRHGLLVPTHHPFLVQPVVCSEGHRNPHISLGKTPHQAWELSGGFLKRRAREQHEPVALWPQIWDLYQVWLEPRKYQTNGGYEYQSRRDIPRGHVVRVGSRAIRE